MSIPANARRVVVYWATVFEWIHCPGLEYLYICWPHEVLGNCRKFARDIRFCQKVELWCDYWPKPIGIGRNTAITEVSDVWCMWHVRFWAQSQLEKIDMIDFADMIAVKGRSRRGSRDALRDFRNSIADLENFLDQQVQGSSFFRLRHPQFNDRMVVNQLFSIFVKSWILKSQGAGFNSIFLRTKKKKCIVCRRACDCSCRRENYLAQIVSTVRHYKVPHRKMAEKASQLELWMRLKNPRPKRQCKDQQASCGKISSTEERMLF